MNKRILVLARRDAYEAIRVAAGLTIRDHGVDFVFMVSPPRDPHGRIKNIDMLEIAEIKPLSIHKDEADTSFCPDLGALMNSADRIVSF